MKKNCLSVFLLILSSVFCLPKVYAGQYIEIISATGEHTGYYSEAPTGGGSSGGSSGGNSGNSGGYSGGSSGPSGSGSSGGSPSSGGSSNSSGGSTGGGSGGSVSVYNPGPMITEAVQEQKAITTEVLNVEVPEKIDVAETQENITEQISKQEEKKEEIAQVNAEKKETSDKKVQETKAKANSEKDGDPVLVTKGEFVQKDVDFCFEKDNFEINRIYKSGSRIYGSFGYSVSSSIDQRIIFYKSNSASDLVAYYENCLSELNKEKSDWIEELKTKGGVSSLEGINEVIEQKEAEIRKLESESEESYNYLKSLREKYGGISDPIAESLQTLELIREKSEALEDFKNKFSQGLDLITSLEEKINEISMEYEKVKSEKIENEKLLELNKVSIFDGTPEEWLNGSEEKIIFLDEENNVYEFKRNENSEWLPDNFAKRKWLRLQKQNSGNYILTSVNGHVYTFYPNGLIGEIKKTNDTKITIERTENGKIKSIKNSFGEEYVFSYSGNYVSKVINVRDVTEKYNYVYTNGFLSTVTDSEEDKVFYEYDNNGCLNKIIKDDKSFIALVYGIQNETGDYLVSQTINEEGFPEFFEYNQKLKQTLYTDHDGNETYYEYDDQNRTVYKKHSDETYVKYIYDANNNVIKENNNGVEISYAYDQWGNCILKKYSDGRSESWKYDQYGNIIFYEDPDKVLYEFFYDNKGNLLSEKKGGIEIFYQTWTQNGLVQKQVFHGSPDIVSNYTYDNHGNLISIRRGDREETFSYDSRNRLVAVSKNGKRVQEISYSPHKVEIRYNSGLKEIYSYNNRKDLIKFEAFDTDSSSGTIPRVFEYEYDKRHLPVKEYRLINNKRILYRKWEYSPEGKTLKEFVFEPDEINFYVKERTYQNGRLKNEKEILSSHSDVKEVNLNYILGRGNAFTMEIINGGDKSRCYKYSLAGYMDSWTDEENQIFQYENSFAGRLLSSTGTNGGKTSYAYGNDGELFSFGEKGKLQNRVSYYPDGRINEFINTKGQKTKYEYNCYGDVISVQDGTCFSFYKYDLDGNLIKKIIGPEDSEENAHLVVSYVWDNSNRHVKVVYGNEKGTKNDFVSEEYFLNVFGEIEKVLDGENNESLFSYDDLGRLNCKTDPYGKKTFYYWNSRNLLDKIVYPDKTFVSYEYNVFGKCCNQKDAMGVIWERQYDKYGNLIKEKHRDGSVTKYKYDKNNRIIEVADESRIIKQISYSNYGKRIVQIDANGNQYIYEKDDFGRPVSEINRLGNKQSYTYDTEGNLTSVIDFNGNKMFFNYSDDNLKTITNFCDGTSSIIEYNMNGNVIHGENSNSNLFYSYNQAGLLIKEIDKKSGEEILYSYDKAGRKKRMTGAGHDVLYSYGKNGEIRSIKDAKLGITVTFEYDSMMREISRSYGNGVVQRKIYDKYGRLEAIIHKNASGELLFAEGYVYDERNLRISTVNFKGQVTLYEYNDRAQLSRVLYPFTEELYELQKREIEKAGFNTSIGESNGSVLYDRVFLNKKQNDLFSAVLEKIYPGASGSLTTVQFLVPEEYVYDLNENRKSKTTKWGKWIYEYDAENNLKNSFLNGRLVEEFEYDKNGNLLTEKTVSSESVFKYNLENRISASVIKNNLEKTVQQNFFKYDCFGRSVVVSETGLNFTETRNLVYDGFSFDVLKEGPVFSNGISADYFGFDSLETGENNFEKIDERYRYFSDEMMSASTGRTTNESFYSLKTSFNHDISYNLYNGGKPFAFNYGGQSCYFGTDILSSVKNITDVSGNENSAFEYDVFGVLISDSVPVFGYNGKRFYEGPDSYDYGYRHYNPGLGRFSSMDPIRYGENWFSYVNGDPVNYVDFFGLDPQVASKINYNGAPSDVRTIIEDQTKKREETYQKSVTKIEVTRSPVQEVDNNDIIRIYVDNVVYASYKCQSEKNYKSGDQTVENRWEPDYANYNATLPCGDDYKVLMMAESPSYVKPFHITSPTVKVNGQSINYHGFMIHKWDKKDKEVTGAYSWGCQILNNKDFDDFRSTLENIGFNNGEYIPLEIKKMK